MNVLSLIEAYINIYIEKKKIVFFDVINEID